MIRCVLMLQCILIKIDCVLCDVIGRGSSQGHEVSAQERGHTQRHVLRTGTWTTTHDFDCSDINLHRSLRDDENIFCSHIYRFRIAAR